MVDEPTLKQLRAAALTSSRTDQHAHFTRDFLENPLNLPTLLANGLTPFFPFPFFFFLLRGRFHHRCFRNTLPAHTTPPRRVSVTVQFSGAPFPWDLPARPTLRDDRSCVCVCVPRFPWSLTLYFSSSFSEVTT